MKKLFSILSGRFMPLLVLAIMVVCFLAPGDAMAAKELRMGRDRTGGGEGDPLDTNDVGGGGGGSDVHDDDGSSAVDDPQVIGYLGYRILLVPEYLDGRIVFRMLVITSTGSYLQAMPVEAYHAP
jgi:hypothetical protein